MRRHSCGGVREVTTWMAPDTRPNPPRPGVLGWIMVVFRTLLLTILYSVGVFLQFLIRLVEKPVHGLARPWSSIMPKTVMRMAVPLVGLRYKRVGRPDKSASAAVANHQSWLDIITLNAGDRVTFVSKADVRGWPILGPLARSSGTIFIERKQSEAASHSALLSDHLEAGHKIVMFPEGTSTDGRQVLPFKSTLFQPFYLTEHVETIQPVTVIYEAPDGTSADHPYGWHSGMTFGPHAIEVLSRFRRGTVTLIYHEPLAVADFANRKALAIAARDAVSSVRPEWQT